MKKWLIAFVFFTILFDNAFGQVLKDINEPVFKIGEQLNYRLKYGIFTGAEASLKVEDGEKKIEGHPTFHIVANGKTAGTFDVFYKVRNFYESYVDKSTLLPYFYSRETGPFSQRVSGSRDPGLPAVH